MVKRLVLLAALLTSPGNAQVLNQGNTSNVLIPQTASGIPSTNLVVGGSASNVLTSTGITSAGFGDLTVGGMLNVPTSSVSAQSFTANGPGQGVVAVQVANSATGTTNGELACWNASGKAITCANTATTGIIGIVYGGAGSTGTYASIARVGTVQCTFDPLSPTITPGHFVINSPNSGAGGMCFDSSVYPSTSQAVGIVVSAGTGVGNVFVINDAASILGGSNISVNWGTGAQPTIATVASPSFTSVTTGQLGVGTASPAAPVDIESTNTLGTLLKVAAPSAVSLTGSLVGEAVNLQNYNAAGQPSTALAVIMPGTISGTGVTSTGIQITGPTTNTGATPYALTSNASAGRVSIGGASASTVAVGGTLEVTPYPPPSAPTVTATGSGSVRYYYAVVAEIDSFGSQRLFANNDEL
jgi:hypothetical protein